MSNVPQMTIEKYLQSARETADPKLLLELIIAENERLKNESILWQQDYREATEVSLDDNLNFRPKTLAQLQRLARMYAESGYVPEHYKGNIANTAIAVQMALRCRVDIMTFLQSSYIVHGKPGIEGKLVIAMLNSSDQVKGRVRFEFSGSGKERQCTAFAVDAATGQEVSQAVTWEMVEKEGWDKNPKWKSLTDLMFCYRSAVFLARVYFPDVLMGMRTLDEIEDTAPAAGVSSFEELTQHITQSLDRSPEQQATDGGSKPRAARGRRGESSKSSALATKAEPVKELAAETSQAFEAEEITSALDPPAPKKATKAESKLASEPAEQPADLKNIPDAELKEKIDRAVKYMKTMYGARCEGFDLNLIALSSSEAPSWAVFCKSVIEKQKPGWENYLLTDSEENEEIPEDDASQEIPETSDQVPDSIENPVQRPAMIGSHASAFEIKIQSLKQAKRIRDMATEFKGHPELLPEEQNYLESLADRRAWYIEHGQEPAKERQIPE